MTSLLRLYQQDAQSPVPALTARAVRVADWIDRVKDYSEHLRERHVRSDGASAREKKIAASCLYLAIEALQVGASVAEALERPQMVGPRSDAVASGGKDTVLAVVMLCLGVFNLWLGSVPGMISMLAVLVLFGHFHRGEISVLNGTFPWQRGGGQAGGEVSRKVAAGADIRSAFESIVRRTDDIVALAEQRTEAPPPSALRASTLEFFQDILEAKLSDDRDYAFKKISRTIGQVLAAEDIEVDTDARANRAMFRLDTVVDARRADQFETVRPALMQNAKCLLPGYARHFVAA